MIINENNKDSNQFKGTMLRGFNNTPSNIRDNIVKYQTTLKETQNKEISKQENKTYDPKRQRELMTKINRINKWYLFYKKNMI